MLPLPGPDPEMSVTPQPITPAPKAAARLPASAEAPAAANDSTASVAALSALLPGRSGPARLLHVDSMRFHCHVFLGMLLYLFCRMEALFIGVGCTISSVG